MKIVIAPDSFKESMTAMQAADSIEKGFRRIFKSAEIIKVPLADGGEGTVQALINATGGNIIEKEVTGPLGERVNAKFGIFGNGEKAVIEMAAASGIHLVPYEKRNPLYTTTRGTGELILAALDAGAKHIILGIGGSATNDGGAGMAKALGIKLMDESGREIGDGGGALGKLCSIDLSDADPRLRHIRVEAACDVDIPLTGEKGASAIFGPQKGADREMVVLLDNNLERYAAVIEKELGKKVKDVPGSGAAGGLGAGLLAFLPAELKRGSKIIIEAVNLMEHIRDASILITGEGKIDDQTLLGKTPIGAARLARTFNVPVIAIAGNVSYNSEEFTQQGINAVFSIVPGIISREDAFIKAERHLEETAANIAAVLKMSACSRFKS
ncbi:glycerate kinase [Bacillus sp. MUM 13]|uniref:glycerate kinase family protein n=1 Tax=Bacillus sp. MUM 13 TaxID=1678001 RepID=UPI0008F5BFCB|nr:glycerate kinase [Bacillus sp. MUM 13]OIK09824.1 glycerate kinase [Bacillus sp. MUM 13]